MKDQLDILGVEKLQKISKEEETFKQLAEDADMAKVLSIPEGRRVLWKIMEYAQTFHESFVPDNQYYTAYNEGKRRVGIFVCQRTMRVNPLMFSKMQVEMNALAIQQKVEREARLKKKKEGVTNHG